MNQRTSDSRVAEWAELVGASVPDSTDVAEESSTTDRADDRGNGG